MADANGTGTTPPAGGQPPAPQDPGATTAPGAGTPPTPPAPADTFDPNKLTREQLNKVLENKELWTNPRLAELLDSDKKLKELTAKQAQAEDESLTKNKQFEELATRRADELAKANSTIQTMRVDQALTNLLVKENVVDLDGALKLIDRNKIQVADDGTVSGVDDALASLKSDKSYLFNASGTPPQPQVGNPSNPQAPAGGSGQFKFKESQLTPEFYQAHKAEIDDAGRLGLIEPDGPPPAR